MPFDPQRRRRLSLSIVAFVVLASCGGTAATTTPSAIAAVSPSPRRASPSPSVPRPTVGPVGAACLTPAEMAAVVRFASDSGVDLGGVLLGTGRLGVVLAHETHANLCEWMPSARWLVERGHRVLAFDLNGLGSSPASPGSPGKPGWDLDVAAATAVLRERGATDVALVGSNIGGIASLVAATRIDPPVSAIVVLSAQVEMSGLDGRAAATAIRVPVLYVTSTSDEYLGDMRSLAAATTGPKRLDVVDVIGHGVDLMNPESNPGADDLRTFVDQFIADPPAS